MSLIPPPEELRERYKDVMADTAITTLSRWIEPNFDEACDEEEYLRRGRANAETMNKTFRQAIQEIET